MFSLYDELFLLALDEEKGNFLPFTKKTVSYGLAGAILAELALRGKLVMNEKQRLIVRDSAPTGDEILDEILMEIETADKARKLSFWVSHLSERPKKLRAQIGECLAAKSLVQQEDNRFHWIIPVAETETLVPTKFEMKNDLREILLVRKQIEDTEADLRRLAVLNILRAADLLNLIFTADELPGAQRLLHEKIMHRSLKDHKLQMIEEIEYAVSESIEDRGD